MTKSVKLKKVTKKLVLTLCKCSKNVQKWY